MKKQYIQSAFKVGNIYKIKYTDVNGVKTKRTILYTSNHGSNYLRVFCMKRKALRTFLVSSITKAKDITYKLEN